MKRSVRNESVIQDVFSFSQLAQNSVRVIQSDAWNESEIRDDLNSKAVKKDKEDTTEYKNEAAEKKNDSKVENIEDKEADKALWWLEMKWEFLTKIFI